MTDATIDTGSARSFLGSGTTRTPAARLGVAVVHDLVSAIVTGEVPPGESLPPEGVLSQQFGVSRTVIRESVKRIEEKGLVTVVQGRGTQVQQPDAWNVVDPVVLSALVEHDDSVGILDELAVVRGSLEGSMSAAAASSRTDDDLARLRASFAAMRDAETDADGFGRADVDFHYLVMEISRNRLAQSITRTLFQRALESYRFTGASSTEAVRLTLEEHSAVLDAIAAGDADAAEVAMRAHIHEAWTRRRLPTHRSAD